MKQNILVLSLISLLFASCKTEISRDFVGEKKRIFEKLYNDSLLVSDLYKINPLRDTLLTSKSGLKFKIYANSFVSRDSSSITEPIEIEVKEAFKPIDFVLGNLTTMSNNKMLMSGGMIYINAKSGENELELKSGSEVGFFVPTKKLDDNMLVYNGNRDTNQIINWVAKDPILNTKLQDLEQTYFTVTYQISGKFDDNDKKFTDWLFESNRKVGDRKKFDTVDVKIIEITRDFVRLRKNEKGLFIPDVITNKGKNGYVEDYNTSYIFSVKKLGWANIDKLFDDPKSGEVEMLAKIDNQNEFGYVFTSMLLPEQNMYLPGYQKKDNTYGFAHNDEEKLVLPIGSKAIIMATAYKDDKPYFKLETITITRNMNIKLNLKETTAEGLKKMLQENI